MAQNIVSNATVSIERPPRYGKQLTNHLRRKAGGAWDAETETGWVNLGEDRAEIAAKEDHLELKVEGPEQEIARLEDVVGRHLVGFARGLTIEVQWQRDNGSEGSRQATE